MGSGGLGATKSHPTLRKAKRWGYHVDSFHISDQKRLESWHILKDAHNEKENCIESTTGSGAQT